MPNVDLLILRHVHSWTISLYKVWFYGNLHKKGMTKLTQQMVFSADQKIFTNLFLHVIYFDRVHFVRSVLVPFISKKEYYTLRARKNRYNYIWIIYIYTSKVVKLERNLQISLFFWWCHLSVNMERTFLTKLSYNVSLCGSRDIFVHTLKIIDIPCVVLLRYKRLTVAF